MSTTGMDAKPKAFKDHLFIRFLPGVCICMIWLYIVVFNHPSCLQQGKGITHCYTNLVDGQWHQEAVLVPRGDLWGEYFNKYWKLTVAMIFGSLIAGSTPLGGGVVAFPVVVLVIGLTPDQGRDFSVAIQSVGMNAAAFLLLTVKPHLLDFKFITVFTVIGTAGVLTGLAWHIKPYFINLTYTTLVLEFAFVYFYTNVLSPRRKSGSKDSSTAEPSSARMLVVHGCMVVAAFFGGIITANVGSGSDIMLYAFGIYVWNVALVDTPYMMPENKLTASSVVVMGLLSIVTFVARSTTDGISMNVWYCLGACAWLVCWGAPLGSLLLTPSLQMTLRFSFYVMAGIQFGAFGIIKIETDMPHVPNKRLSSQETWTLVLVLTAVVILLCAMHFCLQRRRLRAADALAPATFLTYVNRLFPLDKMFGIGEMPVKGATVSTTEVAVKDAPKSVDSAA